MSIFEKVAHVNIFTNTTL